MASTIKVKRSAVSGNAPTTSNLSTGELALNTADGILYSANSTSVFEVGANLTSLSVTGDVVLGGGISIDGGTGAENQVIVSDGSGGVRWQTQSGGAAGISQRDEFIYTATSGQTTFTGSDDNAETLSLTSDYTEVFLNGVLISSQNYTANSSHIVFTSGVNANDVVLIRNLNVVAFTSIVDEATSTNQTITITAGGDVGIGETAPSSKLEVSGTVTATAFSGPLTGDVTGDLTGDVTGNVTGTVSSLSNHDTDDVTEGSSNLYFTNERVDDRVASLLTAGTNVSLSYDDANGTLTVSANDTSVNWSEIQNKPDPVITLAGDLSGSVTLTDLASGTLTATIVANAVALGSDTSGNYVESLVAGTGVTLSNNSGEGATPTVAIGQAVETTSDVTFNTVTADLTGDVTGNVTGNVTGTVSSLSNHDTDDLTEGASNLYYTDARARAAISASGDLSYNSSTGVVSYTEPSPVITLAGDLSGSATLTSLGNATLTATIVANSVALGTDTTGNYVASLVAGTGVTLTNNSGESATPTIAIGQSVGTTDNVTFNNVTVSGTLTSDDITSANISVAGNATITGNLTVSGTTTTVNSNTVNIGDAIITLNADETGTPSQNSGIEIERGTSTNVSWVWDETNDRWTSGSNAIYTTGAISGASLTTTGNITVGGTVDGRDVATDGSKLDGIESGATADQTASEILTLIKTVDGAGSGLDADTLDGISSASFLRSDTADTITATMTVSGGAPSFYFTETDTSTYSRFILSGGDFFIQAGASGSGNATSSGNLRFSGLNNADINALTVRSGGADQTIWHAGNDGASSGLDADTLDGVQGASYLRSDAADSFSGTLTYTGSGVAIDTGGDNIEMGTMTIVGSNGTDGWASKPGIRLDSTNDFRIHAGSGDATLYVDGEIYAGAGAAVQKVWHAGNDGSGSGLDADKLDGQEGSYYLNTSTSFGGDVSGTYNAIVVANDSHTHDGRYYTETEADARYLRSNADDTATGVLTLSGAGSDRLNIYNTTNTGEVGIRFSDATSQAQNGYFRFRHADATSPGSAYGANFEFSTDQSNLAVIIDGSGDYFVGTNKVWHAGNDGNGSGLDADLLDGQQGSYYLNTSTTFGGDVSGTYNAIVVANDSHTHAFNNLTGKTSGTGNYTTTGTFTAATFNATSTTNGGFQGIDADSVTAPSFTWTSDLNTGIYRPAADQVAVAVGGTQGLVVTTSSTTIPTNNVYLAASAARSKYSVWNSTSYGIGMESGYTAGVLNNDYAMTFQMNDDIDRGWWWGDASHTNAQMAMTLTTQGYLAVANAIRLGAGESSTTLPASFSATLDVQPQVNNSRAIHSVTNDTVCKQTLYANYIDYNVSGSDVTTTGDYSHVGLFIDVDSSASGGDTADEHRLYGLMVDVDVSGDSDLVYGFQNTVRTTHTTGSISTLCGSYNLTEADGTGVVSNMMGCYNYAISGTVASGVVNAYACYNRYLKEAADTATTSSAYGSYNEVETTAASGTVTNAYGVYAVVDDNSSTCTNTYAVRAVIEGGSGTRYGVYASGCTHNYFAGEMWVTGNVTAYYSDQRLKSDIKPIEGALDKIKAINGVTYYNNDIAKENGYIDETLQYGVLAQEVEKVMPEIVKDAPFDQAVDEETGTTYSKSGENYKTVQYERMIPVLIEAMKEQQNEIDELKALVKDLINSK